MTKKGEICLKEVFIYPATFRKSDGCIWVQFIDFACYAVTGKGKEATCEIALEKAREALALHLIAMQDDGDEIPEPTSIEQLNPDGGTIVMVEVVLPLYRLKYETTYERTTVTVPKWLKEYAAKKKVNFSKVLTDGLIKALGLKKRV